MEEFEHSFWWETVKKWNVALHLPTQVSWGNIWKFIERIQMSPLRLGICQAEYKNQRSWFMARNEIKGEWNLFSRKKMPEQKRQARSTICPFARIHLSSDQFVTVPVIFLRIIPQIFFLCLNALNVESLESIDVIHMNIIKASTLFLKVLQRISLAKFHLSSDPIVNVWIGPSLTQKKTFSPLWTIVLKSLQNELRLVFISSYFLWNNVTVIRNRSSILLLILYM